MILHTSRNKQPTENSYAQIKYHENREDMGDCVSIAAEIAAAMKFPLPRRLAKMKEILYTKNNSNQNCLRFCLMECDVQEAWRKSHGPGYIGTHRKLKNRRRYAVKDALGRLLAGCMSPAVLAASIRFAKEAAKDKASTPEFWYQPLNEITTIDDQSYDNIVNPTVKSKTGTKTCSVNLLCLIPNSVRKGKLLKSVYRVSGINNDEAGSFQDIFKG